MKILYLIIFFLILCFDTIAYDIGEYNTTYSDPSRNNRSISTTIFYPIDTMNPLSTYPYFVYGHGWNGSCDSYGYLTNNVVNQGWIIVYPRTEEGGSTDTENLALDMAFLKEQFYLETLDFTSQLYSKIDTLAIVGGYSMGGACAVAAASWEPSFASLVTLAAAPITLLNLYPEAIYLASGVEAPSVTFSGSADWVASPSNNQVPIYNNLASVFKSFVSLTGQGHTNFYNNPLIYVILEPWLNFIKTGSVYYIDAFEAVLSSYPSSTLTYQIVDNLIIELDAPSNLVLETLSTGLKLSWDRILEAHSYKVFASDNPYTDYVEITAQGTFSGTDRISWITGSGYENRKFYFVKAYR